MRTYFKAFATETGVPAQYQTLTGTTRKNVEEIIAGMAWSYNIEEVTTEKSDFEVFCEVNGLDGGNFASLKKYRESKQ